MEESVAGKADDVTESTAPGLDQVVEAAREDVLDRIMLGSAIVIGLGAVLHLLGSDMPGLLIYGLVSAALFGLKQRSEWSLKFRVVILLALLYLAAIARLATTGIASSAALFLVTLPPLAILLLGNKAGVSTIVLSMATWLGAGLVFRFTDFTVTSPASTDIWSWIYAGIDLLIVTIVFVQFLQQFRETQDYVITVAQQKRDLLEMRAELIKRTNQLGYERYLLHTLLDTVSDKIFFKDLSGRFTRISQAVAQQFDVPPHMVLGRTDFDFFAVEYAQQIQAEERRMLENNEAAVMDKVEKETWRDGRPDTWAIKSRLLLKGDDGKSVGWFGTARDITDIKQAQESDRRRAQQLAIVAEVSRAVTSSLDIQDLLRVLVDLVRETFIYYGVNVWLLTEAGDTVQLKAGFSPQGEDLSQNNIELPVDKPNRITRVCQMGTHQLASDLEGLQDVPLSDKFPEARSLLVLPLKVIEKTLGALDIRSARPGAFAQEDVMVLRSLADQVTIAIRNASLYQSEQSRRHFAETLYQVGRALSSTLNLPEVLKLILNELDEIVPADRAALMLLENQELEVVASIGFPSAEQASQLRVPIKAEDVFDQICHSQQPLSISDVAERPDWQQVEGLPETHSWLGVPLIRSDQVIGMLSLTRQEFKPYTQAEVTLAQTFAGQASLALENARLYDNLARFNQQLEEMVQERTEQLRQAYDQLERLDRTKSDFITVTSHELRTPLTVLRGYSEMLQQDTIVKDNAMLSQLVSGIYSGSVRMHEIVNSMLDIAKIDSHALHLSSKPLAMAFLVTNVIGKFEGALKQRKLTLTTSGLEELPSVEGDPEALQKVFYHLIGNAIKYTPDGGQITVAGRALETGEMGLADSGIEIVVSDTGIGVDPAMHELIFVKFYQTGEVALHSTGKTKFKGGGPGLGLPIAQGVVQAHGGKLWVESSGHDEVKCPGSHFHIVLPIHQQLAVAKECN